MLITGHELSVLTEQWPSQLSAVSSLCSSLIDHSNELTAILIWLDEVLSCLKLGVDPLIIFQTIWRAMA